MQVFIFHFRPIEHYPPIQNLLKQLNKSEKVKKIYCFSTKSSSFISIDFGSKVKVLRLGKVGGKKIHLWMSYVFYNIYSILQLWVKRPNHLMFFETLSAYPVYFYKRYVNSKAIVYIHYHEYTSPNEYTSASKIERYIHALEKRLYAEARWISHTNEIRLNKFLVDESLEKNEKNHHIMPNYPSRDWAITNQSNDNHQPLKIVYVGYSLTEKQSYFKELITFLKNSNRPIEINLYLVKSNEFIEKFNGTQNKLSVNVHQAIPYDRVPHVLSQHHVGLILYIPVNENVVHCAPNKLFEYLSCGLDIWYPIEMLGIHDYESRAKPKVIGVNYRQIEKYSLNDLLEGSDTQNKIAYFAEDVYGELIKVLSNNA